MSFEISKCIEKDLFISICKEGIELSKIVLAPFGFHDDLQSLYQLSGHGEESNTHDIGLLKTSFQQWEEVISRHVFKNCYDINDDQIAASFHQYLEVDKDPEIIELLQSAALCCIRSIEHKHVVDMTLPITMTKGSVEHHTHTTTPQSKRLKQGQQLKDSFNVNDPMITAVILKRLLNALSLIGDGLYELHNLQNHACTHATSKPIDISASAKSSSVENIDENIFHFFNLLIPLRPFSIQENFKNIDGQSTAKATNNHKSIAANDSSKTKITYGLNLLRQVLTIRLNRQLVPQQQYNHSNHPLSTSHFEYTFIADTNIQSTYSSSYDSCSISEKSIPHTPMSPTSNNINNNTEYSVILSVEQYYMLLKLYQFTPEVSAIFEMFQLLKPNEVLHDDILSVLQMGGGIMFEIPSFSLNSTTPVGSSSIPPPPPLRINSSNKSVIASHDLNAFDNETLINNMKLCMTTTHALQYFLFHVCYDPSVRYVLQLQELAKSTKSLIKDEAITATDDNDDDIMLDLSNIHLGSNDDDDDASKQKSYKQIVYCLSMLTNISELRAMAKSTAEDEGDVEKSVKMLTHAVDNPYKMKQFDEEDKDEEEGEEEDDDDDENEHKDLNYQKCLNTHLKCLLLVDRANYCQQFLEMSSQEWEAECQETKTPMVELVIDSEQVELVLQYLTLIYLDCKTAIILDKYCLKAYSILAKQQLWLSKYLHNLSIVSVKQHPYDIEDYSNGKSNSNFSAVINQTTSKESDSKNKNIIFPIYKNEKYLFWNVHDDFSLNKTNRKDQNSCNNESEIENCASHITANDHHYLLVKNYLLHQAVRNSLTAFLLSGCADVEYATLAEECARESCRDEAKSVYKKNHISYEKNNINYSRNETENNLLNSEKNISGFSPTVQPKEWMLQAFFYGHNLLSTAYSIDLMKCLVCDLENESNTTTNLDEHHNTLDKDLKSHITTEHNSNEYSLVEPPLFLLDTICVDDIKTDATNNDDQKNGQSSESSITRNKYVHDGDRYAYKLLKQCIGMIDGMWLSSNNNSNNTSKINTNSMKNTITSSIYENRDNIHQAFASSPAWGDSDGDYVLVDKKPELDVYIGLDTITNTVMDHNINNKNTLETQKSINYIACIDKEQFLCHRANNINDMLSFCSAAQNGHDWLVYTPSPHLGTKDEDKGTYEVEKTFSQAFSHKSAVEEMSKVRGYLVDYGQLNDCKIIEKRVATASTAILSADDDSDDINKLIQATDQLMNNHSVVKDKVISSSVSESESESSIQSAPPSQVFIDVWSLLSTPEACRLTGVALSRTTSMNSTHIATDVSVTSKEFGQVVHIQSIEPLSHTKSNKTSLKKKHTASTVKNKDYDNDEEEEEWEDIEDEEENNSNEDESDEDDEEHNNNNHEPLIPLDQILAQPVSYALRARLLNLLSSLLYLSGDALHAIECLRNSLIACQNAIILEELVFPNKDANSLMAPIPVPVHDNNSSDIPQKLSTAYWLPYSRSNQDSSNLSTSATNTKNSEQILTLLNDTELKLASLLCDMDETDEAENLLKSIMKKDGRNYYILIHLAELYIHQSKFELALQHLSDAKYYIYQDYDTIKNIRKETQIDIDNRYNRYKDIFHDQSTSAVRNPHKIISQKCIKDFFLYKKYIQDQMTMHSHKCAIASIYSLMAAAMFRLNPMEPEQSLTIMKEGLEMHPDSIYMMLCQGEIYSQMGDAMAALQLYKKVSLQVPNNPLPYLNASRVYQQIKLHSESYHHVNTALKIDDQCSMSKVDLAQYYLHAGDLDMSILTLEDALNLAKHVSEIKDVLTAKIMTLVQIELHKEGFWNANLEN